MLETTLRSGCFAVFALVAFACSAFAQDAFETPEFRQTSDILPADLLQSEFHTVDDEVRSDGYLNYYTIRSDYGDFEAQSTQMLRARVREVGALAQLDETSKTEVFIEAAADAGVGQIRTIGQFVTKPVETVKGIPSGIGRLFRTTRRQASDGYDAAREYVADNGEANDGEETDGEDDGITTKDVTNTATSAAGWYLGVSSAERAWHQELGTDPYTSNLVLQEAIKSFAWADRLGRFGIRAAGLPRIPGVGVLSDVNSIVWSKDPYELQDLNTGRLTDAGADEALIEAFFDNPAFSPTLQTYLVAAISELADVEDRDGIVRQSLAIETEIEAIFFTQSVVMLSWYHLKQSPLERINSDLMVPFGYKAEGGSATLLASDHIFWTESIAGRTELHAGLRGDGKHDLWVSGTLSDRARDELSRSGYQLRENVNMIDAVEDERPGRR